MSIRDRIRDLMADGQWRTGLEIALAIGRASYTTGIAAKLRQLRDPRYGGHRIESEFDSEASKRSARQVWRFRMLVPDTGNCLDSAASRGMTMHPRSGATA